MTSKPAQSFTVKDPRLSLPIRDFAQLSQTIQLFAKIHHLEALQHAILDLTAYVHHTTQSTNWDFYQHLLPKIQEWAVDGAWQGLTIPVLAARKVGSLTRTAPLTVAEPRRATLNEQQSTKDEQQSTKDGQQSTQDTVTVDELWVRHVLANAFFCAVNTKDTSTSCGLLSFWQLYSADLGVSRARIECLLCYFYVSNQIPATGHKITFQRVSLTSPPPLSYAGTIPPNWRTIDTVIKTQQIHIHDGRMESPTEATAFVDFANRDLHIHQIIPSATQEEVLFSCCPEAFPGILFCERMMDDEVIIIKGCRRFCEYSGYLFSFAFTKAFNPPLPAQDIIAIDAVYSSHFTEAHNIRDLNKAFLGFLQCQGDGTKISTGFWGCGAFGGDKIHKFLQQVCAATLTNTPLFFSSYQDRAMCDQLKLVLQDIQDSRATVADLFNIMVAYKPSPMTAQSVPAIPRPPFPEYFKAEITRITHSNNNNNNASL